MMLLCLKKIIFYGEEIMVYCNFCEYLDIDEEEHFCCVYNDNLLLSFNMGDLYNNCPKND